MRDGNSHKPVGHVLTAPSGVYGGDRIAAGARFLDHLDPGWWREGALLPACLATLDMADPHRCVLACWAAQNLPAPAHRGTRQMPPYDRAKLALCLSSQRAHALGFTGADADLLTPGWRHLIACLRASHDRRAALDRARGPRWRHRPRRVAARAGQERGFSWPPAR
jgi:hypothetical protein